MKKTKLKIYKWFIQLNEIQINRQISGERDVDLF